MVLVGGQGPPLEIQLPSASPSEHAAAGATLAKRVTWRRPSRIIADRAYGAPILWERMRRLGIDLIVQRASNRRR